MRWVLGVLAAWLMVGAAPASADTVTLYDEGGWSAIEVLSFDGERVSAIVAFVSTPLFERFGLPPELH
jgi:hypothetical protein